MQMIKCEITKVFSANDKGIGFAMKPDAITDEVKQLKTWNEKFKTLTATWWFNKKPQPRWIIEEQKYNLIGATKMAILNLIGLQLKR